ncbi:MAG: crossover junction endodeoxyribonuclease RuvC [Anaerolineae bacterium]|nr:crossover junction endodeoxyribonuclease RuvC [Anaerolineae bacterium]
MLALGIDPGTATVGYGLVRQLHDGALQTVKYGVITTPAGQPMPERLRTIYDELTALIEIYKPDQAAVEQLYFGKNITTAITVAQGRGVILLSLSLANLPIAEYQPSIIKQTVTGYGGAKKPQMQEMVRMLLGLDTVPKPDDAADALAIAITAIQYSQMDSLY